MMLSEKLRALRELSGLPQRKVAAALDIDTATYCKIENGNYAPRKEQVIRLSEMLASDKNDLLKLWLADKFIEVAENDKENTPEALKIVQEQMKKQNGII